MTQPNAIDQLFRLVKEVRSDPKLWTTEYEGARKRMWWEAKVVGTRGLEVQARCVPLRRRPRHIVITAKIKMKDGPHLTLRPVVDRPRSERRRWPRSGQRGRSRRVSASEWRQRQRLRGAYEYFGETPDTVPLVAEDAELKALVALRCLQQDCHAKAAYEVLRSYAGECRSADGTDLMGDVLSEVWSRFVAPKPGGLRKYIVDLCRAIRAREANAQMISVPSKPGTLLTVSQYALLNGVCPRTVYRWIETGVVEPAERDPYRLEYDVRSPNDSNKGAIYALIQQICDCSYDAARMRVLRRRRKGMSDREILEDCGIGSLEVS